MPRMRPIYSELFYDPLTEDVEELLARFQRADSVRYQLFSSIWKEMGFSDIFIGEMSISEMKRFSRVALATALKYFMPPYSYQIRVGGLYLLFGFYHTQLVIPPVKIRLALKDWDPVQKFLKESVDAGHYDVVYIYRKLVSGKAFHYVAMPHFLTYDKQRKPKVEPVCAEFLSRTTAVPDLLSSDIVEELTNIQDKYENLKEATVEVSCHVTMTHRDVASRLIDCMSEFIKWQQKVFPQNSKDKNTQDEAEKPGVEESNKNSSSSRARLLSSIKSKSYSNFQEASRSRRHRQPEPVDSSSSGAEQLQEFAVVKRKGRPPSLRARTTESLRVVQEEDNLQTWLLSAPEGQEKIPMKRINQPLPYRARQDG
ncbi:snRNA-activating protein complex subunit 1-like [Solea solea]|uniref:snRNA-activating protein complex subunit 1-like n=1 Tax=Solea solea TaxID=90069 RepID=UPI00272C3B57|nr:snRNA-activating protein complex subunit 1-like [Solea solea]